MKAESYDLVVVGAGSGGLAAAITAARLGCRVLLIEKADELGGTAVRAGVNCWEPGVGGTGLPFDIYKRLRDIPKAVGIYSFGRHRSWGTPSYPGGESLIDPERTYLDSLRRFGGGAFRDSEAFIREYWHGVVFEPDAYVKVIREMLAETQCCTVRTNTTFRRVDVRDGHITQLELDDGTIVTGNIFVDAAGDVTLARACGCRTMIGKDGYDAFQEPDAPAKPSEQLNGVSLIFRVRARNTQKVDSLPERISKKCWWREKFPCVSVFQYSNGDLNVNMLPTMEGLEAMELGPEKAYAECLRRLQAQWHYCQTIFPEFQRYEIIWIAPELGVRESYRLVGKYVLTEHDLLAGLSGQSHEDIIAIADHAMDTHGGSASRCGELAQPYGIPYRCLLPEGIDNLLVACRGASFSAIAASSCRLSRTMISLGQAAGAAAWLALKNGNNPARVNILKLQELLRKEHVQLDWPMSEELRFHLACNHPMKPGRSRR